MLELQLFRILVLYNSQQNLFISEWPNPKELLTNLVFEHPSYESSRRITWHIGNVEQIDENGFYFRFGKTTRSLIEYYENGNFQDVDFEMSPYTHIFLDTNLEVCSIAQKTKLARSTRGIANRLRDVLNYSTNSPRNIGTFEIKELKDPQGFIEYIKSAYNIKKFWVTIPPPNAWDVDKDFTKPFQKTIKEINANKSKAEFSGNELDSKKIEPIARTVASLGQDASLTYKDKAESKYKTKRLKANKVVIPIEEDLIDKNKQNIINKIRSAYKNIKESNSEE